jgi:hypothetical protein
VLVRSSPGRTTLLRVRRRCLVCDSETVVEEPADTLPIGPACPECRASTERLEILGRHSAPAERNPAAAALGRLGGLKGGPARAKALSAGRRREIASLAARRRWSRRGPER